jgi:nicotinamide riboside kinase
MTHVVNFYGGPGTGKSTHAAALFTELKRRHMNVELVTEYAKDLVWEERFVTLENQIYVFGKQLQRMARLVDKADIVVTDSPLLFSIIYNSKLPACFNDTVLHVINQFKNIHIFLERTKPYQTAGRMQTEEDAKKLDGKIKNLLNEIGLPYSSIQATAEPKLMSALADKILTEISNAT